MTQSASIQRASWPHLGSLNSPAGASAGAAAAAADGSSGSMLRASAACSQEEAKSAAEQQRKCAHRKKGVSMCYASAQSDAYACHCNMVCESPTRLRIVCILLRSIP